MGLLAYPVPEVASLRTSVLASTAGKSTTILAGHQRVLVQSGAVNADVELLFAIPPTPMPSARASMQPLSVVVIAVGLSVNLAVELGGASATISIVTASNGEGGSSGQGCSGKF